MCYVRHVRFDLVDLQLFLHVHDAGSITGGAARSHLTLASASERIRALEDRFGAPLLDRHSRGVRVNAAGQALVRNARAVLEACDRLQAELAPHAVLPVRLWANSAACGEHLPALIETFLCTYPADAVEVVEASSGTIGDAVRSGRCDVGVAAGWSDLHGLDVFPFREDRLVLVVAAADALADRTSVRLNAVSARPLLGLPASSALQQHIDDQAHREGVVLSVRTRAPTFEAACRMAGLGLGVAIVPEAAAQRHAAATGTRWIALDHPWAVRTLNVCVRGGASPPVQRLASHVRGVRAPRR